MSEPVGIRIPESGFALTYDIKTAEVKAYLPDGREYPLKAWSLKLVDMTGGTTEITRKRQPADAGTKGEA